MIDLTFVNETFTELSRAFSSGWYGLHRTATFLIGVAITLQLFVFGFEYITQGKPHENLIEYIAKIAFWTVIVGNFPAIMNTIGYIFTIFGARAAGSGNIITSPSGIMEAAIRTLNPLLEALTTFIQLDISEQGAGGAALNFFLPRATSAVESGVVLTQVIANLPKILIGIVVWLAAMISYIIITGTYILSFLEFRILTGLGVILIPFGLFKHTSYFTEKLVGSITGHGVKLMLLQFVIGIGLRIFAATDGLINPGDTINDLTYNGIFDILIKSIIFLIIALNIPSMATGILSGNPTLSSQGFAQAATIANAGANIGRTAGQFLGNKGLNAARGAVSAGGGISKAVNAAKQAAQIVGGAGGNKGDIRKAALRGFGGSVGQSAVDTITNTGRKLWNNLATPKTGSAQASLNQKGIASSAERQAKSTGAKDFLKKSSVEGGQAGKGIGKQILQDKKDREKTLKP